MEMLEEQQREEMELAALQEEQEQEYEQVRQQKEERTSGVRRLASRGQSLVPGFRNSGKFTLVYALQQKKKQKNSDSSSILSIVTIPLD